MKNVFLTVCCVATLSFASAGEISPRYFDANPGALARTKALITAHDPSVQRALKNLLGDADAMLPLKPLSVVDKNQLPPSADKHDYMSVAPYYWPDPAKPNGLPYIRHDGKVNPESRDEIFDHGRIQTMGNTVETLALAYYFTGNEAYASQAAKWLRVWFLDPATRMNPSLQFAQAVPGENTGRGTGILEGRHVAVAADAAELLAPSPAWTVLDRAGFKSWLEKYFDWLRNSKNGRDESNAKNNHGTWYDVQAVEIALVLGKNDVAREIAETAKSKRIGAQIQPDGRQPLELERTAALGYSHFNLEALTTLATLSQHVGVDLWHCQLKNGKYAIAAALDYLLPYIAEVPEKWPYQQIKKFNRTEFAPLLRQAAVAYRNPNYDKLVASFPDSPGKRFQLVCPSVLTMVGVGEIDRNRILNAAAAALTAKPFTITKTISPHSTGGKNDFFSMADYYWPNPTNANGLPYVQRDGESNPDNFNDHRMEMRNLRDAVAALGAAYKITRDERYAKKAAELLRVFFLDPATRMNPHLEYAQAVLGRYTGRSYGIIDALHLAEVPPAIAAMETSPSFPPEFVAQLKQWFADLSQWMVTSKNGRDEGAAKNNHAVAYWVQIACFSKFTGDEKLLAECRRQFKEVFVPNQMAADGSFPLELKRTKPYAYSIFQLDNMTTLCQVLSVPNDNLWTFELTDGRGIRMAVAYLYPYLADKSRWPLKPDVMAWEGWPARQSNLLFAGLAFNEPKYLELWKKLPPDPANVEVRRNIAITQPVLWTGDGH